MAWDWVLLIVASFFAAIVDSSVGGGGIIRLPAILAFGVPPHAALGTNKLAATGASSVSAVQYWRSGLLDKRLAGPGWMVAVLASAAGAFAILQVSADALVWLIIGALTLLLAYPWAQPRFGLSHQPLPFRRRSLLLTLGLALVFGFYDGFLGPGTGTFLIVGFVVLLGNDVKHAAAHGRILNFGSNVGALALFAAMGSIDWLVGGVLLLVNAVGGWLGSSLTIRADTRWIRLAFLVVGTGVLVALVVSNWGTWPWATS